MRINNNLLEQLSAQAKACERLRMNLDLRTSADDSSQRMLNALEPGTPLPIHRHRFSTETVVMVRGSLKQIFYNDNGEVTDIILMQAGGECPALQIPKGQWHTVEVLETGTIIFEAKDGAYAPLSDEDILKID
jgi:cupin fold WbuC family metalloprotein